MTAKYVISVLMPGLTCRLYEPPSGHWGEGERGIPERGRKRLEGRTTIDQKIERHGIWIVDTKFPGSEREKLIGGVAEE